MAYKQLATPNAMRFDGAGTFRLIEIDDSGKPSTDKSKMFTAGNAAMGVINAAWALTTEELRDENNQDPRAVYHTGVTETITIEMRSDDPYLDAYLKGGTVVQAKDLPVPVIDVAMTVRASATGDAVIELVNEEGESVKLDKDSTVLVRNAMTNEDYDEIEGGGAAPKTPKEYEFVVDYGKGTFTFHKDALGRNLFISASVIAGSAERFVRPKNPVVKKYMLELFGKAEAIDQTNKRNVYERYPSVQLAGGDLSALARQLAPGASTSIEFQKVAYPGCEGSERIYTDVLIDTTDC